MDKGYQVFLDLRELCAFSMCVCMRVRVRVCVCVPFFEAWVAIDSEGSRMTHTSFLYSPTFYSFFSSHLSYFPSCFFSSSQLMT